MTSAANVATSPTVSSKESDDLKVISSVGMKALLEEAIPDFPIRRKLKILFGTAAPLKRQIDAGETFDVVILTTPLVSDLVEQGIVDGGTTARVAKSEMGVAMRQGARKPDISSASAFKAALLDATAIAYSTEGRSGKIMAELIKRLGIAPQIAPKTVLETRSGGAPFNVAEGRAELAFGLVSEILPVPGVALAGPFPPELQIYVEFSAGIARSCRQKESALAFVDFLKSDAAVSRLKSKGMERV